MCSAHFLYDLFLARRKAPSARSNKTVQSAGAYQQSPSFKSPVFFADGAEKSI
jgi:hypothetical protein